MSSAASPLNAAGAGDGAASSESSVCHTCGVAIATAQFIRVGGYKFHKDHFTCCVCATSLHGAKFHHKEGKFYCAHDYVDKFCHTCRHCKQKIATGSVIQAFGGYYHPEHFVCKTCSKPFQNGKYYEANDEPYCLAEGTPLARAAGTSVAIEHATELPELLSCSNDDATMVHAQPTRHIKRGVKACVELLFADGRTLVCTPDHRLRTSDGAWVHAADLEEQHSAVVAAAVPPLAPANEDEWLNEQWFLDAAGHAFTMRSPAERERALAFARLLGYTYALPLSASLPALNSLDTAALLHDARLLDPSLAPKEHEDEDLHCSSCTTTSFSSQPLVSLPTLPASVAAALVPFHSSPVLPVFLTAPTCPLPLVREFLAALMGRHALPPALTHDAHMDDAQQCTAMLLPAALAPIADQLRTLLARFGVDAQCDAAVAVPASPSPSLSLSPASLLPFYDTVGVRFASLTAQRLALAAGYQRALACFPKAAHLRSFDSFLSECGPHALSSFLPSSSPSAPVPPFSLRLVSRRAVGDRPVYDLSIPATNLMFANGLAAHNCDEHYFLITAEKCAACGEGVKDADMVRVQGKVFHSSCLACCHCGLPLARKGSIFQKDGNVYCRSDYLNFFCKRCTGCAQHILRHCVSVNDEFYHPDCLKCSACSKKLDKYICISGSLRCNEHTELGVEPISCSQCNKLIEGEVVLSVGMKLHPACFKCAQCQKPLAKSTAKLKDDKQLCCPECMLKKDPTLRARNAAAALADAQKGGAEELDDAAALASVKGPAAREALGSPKATDPDAFTKYQPTPKSAGHGKKASRALPGGKIEWKKGELIGKGSFGKVYMAMNSATGELIAVKQVRLTTAEEQEQAASIQNEIGLMENLRHPNIVSLLGTQRNGNKLNILMEYVPGKCWAPDTPVLLADGQTKLVRDVAEGDELMGDDCTARRVLPGTIVEGVEPMFEVACVSGAARRAWQCNAAHILVLRMDAAPWVEQHSSFWTVHGWTLAAGSSTDSQLPQLTQLGDAAYATESAAQAAAASFAQLLHQSRWMEFECSVADYLKLSAPVQQLTRLFQPELVAFPAPRDASHSLSGRMEALLGRAATEQEMRDAAWMMGVGFTQSLAAQQPHPAVAAALQQQAAAISLLQELQSSYSLLDGQQLPSELLLESPLVRRALLGGLLDGTAAFSALDGGFLLPSSSPALFLDGVAFVARSLGLRVSATEQGVLIAGEQLASVQPLHSASVAAACKSAGAVAAESCLERFTISAVGLGAYRGFRVSGNGRLLLSDFVVTHNSLDSLLEKFGGFSEKVIRSYTKQLLEALSYCHANRVVHRDIKGKNILIDTKGNLKLADFGSAKRFTNVMSKDAPSLSYNYTPLWTAPEVLVGDYNSKVDIWSLGCVIIEMASAKPPWSEQNFENPFRALYHIGNSDAIPKIPDTLSEVGIAFVKQCLRRNPDERPDATTLLKQDWLSGIESLPNTSDDSGSDGEDEGIMKSGSESD